MVNTLLHSSQRISPVGVPSELFGVCVAGISIERVMRLLPVTDVNPSGVEGSCIALSCFRRLRADGELRLISLHSMAGGLGRVALVEVIVGEYGEISGATSPTSGDRSHFMFDE